VPTLIWLSCADKTQSTVVRDLFLRAYYKRRFLSEEQLVIHWTRNTITKDNYIVIHLLCGVQLGSNGKRELELIGCEDTSRCKLMLTKI